MRISSHNLTYGDDFSGGKLLRAAISHFANRHFQPLIPITPAHVAVTAGVTNAIEVTAWSFGDPGDGVLLGRPFYTAFVNDMRARAESLTANQLKSQPLTSAQVTDPFSLKAVGEYEKALLNSHDAGTRIRALMLCSPHNPLGVLN
jgi:aspartate/methionine/tyrosine aminotransferase